MLFPSTRTTAPCRWALLILPSPGRVLVPRPTSCTTRCLAVSIQRPSVNRPRRTLSAGVILQQISFFNSMQVHLTQRYSNRHSLASRRSWLSSCLPFLSSTVPPGTNTVQPASLVAPISSIHMRWRQHIEVLGNLIHCNLGTPAP